MGSKEASHYEIYIYSIQLRNVLADQMLVRKDAKRELKEKAVGYQPRTVEAAREAPHHIFVFSKHLRPIHVKG